MFKTPIVWGVVFAAFCIGCDSPTPTEQEDIYPVVEPIQQDTEYEKEYVAEIAAKQNVEIRTHIKGFIESIHVDEGKPVQKGQLLVRLSNQIFLQQFERAKAQKKSIQGELKSAQIELLSTKNLFEKGIVSKPEFDMVSTKVEILKAKTEEAEAQEAEAKLHLSYAEIRAPFAGIINRIPYKVGSLVEEGVLLTTLSSTGDVYAYFNVSEADYLEYFTNKDKIEYQTVRLTLANNIPYESPGIIETLESEFDASTGNIAFRARFPNPTRILRHGSNGKVALKKELKNALLIPQRSTFEIQDKVYVFVVKSDSTVEQRNIVPLMRYQDFFAVGSGIKPNERIIFEGVQNLRSGDKVKSKSVDVRTELATDKRSETL